MPSFFCYKFWEYCNMIFVSYNVVCIRWYLFPICCLPSLTQPPNLCRDSLRSRTHHLFLLFDLLVLSFFFSFRFNFFFFLRDLWVCLFLIYAWPSMSIFLLCINANMYFWKCLNFLYSPNIIKYFSEHYTENTPFSLKWFIYEVKSIL